MQHRMEPVGRPVPTQAQPGDMTNALDFAFDGVGVRIEMVDGEPWFCARDVGVCLGLGRTAVVNATGRMESEDKTVILNDTLGGKQGLVYVSEAGLYEFIMTSRKPAARRFRKWVTKEVLPSIRKTGAYSMPAAGGDLLPHLKDAANQLTAAVQEIERARERAEVAEQLVAELEPRAMVANRIAASKGVLLIQPTCTARGWNQRKFTQWAIDKGLFYRQPRSDPDKTGPLRAKSAFADRGIVAERVIMVDVDPEDGTEISRYQAYITPAGLLWLDENVPDWVRKER